MAMRLATGATFDITKVNDQYHHATGDHGLRKTLIHYQEAKNPTTGDYNFGKITELYYDLQGAEKAHWRRSIATFADLHPLLKSVITTALNNRPDALEIQWNFDKDARPAGANITQGVQVVFDTSVDPPKYNILIFGYTMPE